MVKASEILSAESIAEIKKLVKACGGRVTAIESYDPAVGPHWIGDPKKTLMKGWEDPNKTVELSWE